VAWNVQILTKLKKKHMNISCSVRLYKSKEKYIIQGDQKICWCTWWLQLIKLQVTFKVYPDSLQTYIDTPNCVLEDRVQNSTVRILPNVFCDGHIQIINCVVIVRIHWVQVNRDFLITLYKETFYLRPLVQNGHTVTVLRKVTILKKYVVWKEQ